MLTDPNSLRVRALRAASLVLDDDVFCALLMPVLFATYTYITYILGALFFLAILAAPAYFLTNYVSQKVFWLATVDDVASLNDWQKSALHVGLFLTLMATWVLFLQLSFDLRRLAALAWLLGIVAIPPAMLTWVSFSAFKKSDFWGFISTPLVVSLSGILWLVSQLGWTLILLVR